ncbi:hypothetical protein B0H14DRAFT_3904882 [Mycena olivaceomarginata]|nr:hypothetical protein B0H14DRAFT_3904882 [Mycena olivaceomarginata]
MRFQFALAAIAISSVVALPVAERSIFDKTSVISSTKHINAPVEDVIATLHDFQKMINLKPSLTDSVPLFLGISLPTTYTATFKAVDDGMNTDNAVAAGVSLHNEWRAVANATGGTDLTETDTLTANFLLSGIITSELTTSHNQLVDTLATQLEAAAGTAIILFLKCFSSPPYLINKPTRSLLDDTRGNCWPVPNPNETDELDGPRRPAPSLNFLTNQNEPHGPYFLLRSCFLLSISLAFSEQPPPCRRSHSLPQFRLRVH